MSRGRQIAIALLIAGLVLLLGKALTGGLAMLDVREPSGQPNLPEFLALEPPPDFGPAPSIAERRAFWMQNFLTGDEDDAQWGLRQIRHDGDPSRAAVIDAAKRAMASSPALVQHTLDMIADDPRVADREFAVAALESRSEQTIIRAANVLGVLGKAAGGCEERLAQLGVERSLPVPRHVFTALARIGTPAAVAALNDAFTRADRTERGWVYVALGTIGSPRAVEILKRHFGKVAEDAERASIAEGLTLAGDDTALPWLRERSARLGDGSTLGEAMLRVLANAKDGLAREKLVFRATDPLEQDDRREQAVTFLRNYPVEDVDEALRFASVWRPRGTTSENPRKVRIAALESRVLMEAPGAEEQLHDLLFAAGDGGAADREVAALVVGRLRRAELADDVAEAIGTLAPTEERLRTWFLRALVLCGDPAYADTVVAGIAADTGPFGVGGVAFDVYVGLGGATRQMRTALGASVRRALPSEFGKVGEFGELSGSGLQHLILAAGWAEDRDAASLVEPFMLHDVREIRDAALRVLPEIGRRESLAVMRKAWRRKMDAGQREALRLAMQKLHHSAE